MVIDLKLIANKKWQKCVMGYITGNLSCPLNERLLLTLNCLCCMTIENIAYTYVKFLNLQANLHGLKQMIVTTVHPIQVHHVGVFF